MIIIRYKANFIMKFIKIIRIDFSIETRSLQKNQFSFIDDSKILDLMLIMLKYSFIRSRPKCIFLPRNFQSFIRPSIAGK